MIIMKRFGLSLYPECHTLTPACVWADHHCLACIIKFLLGLPQGSAGEESLCRGGETQGIQVRSVGQEDLLGKEMAIHSSILAWKISWTEEPGGLQSMRLQRCDSETVRSCMSNFFSKSSRLGLSPPTYRWRNWGSGGEVTSPGWYSRWPNAQFGLLSLCTCHQIILPQNGSNNNNNRNLSIWFLPCQLD